MLQAGLASGDKCICVVDGTPPGEIVAALGPAGQAAALAVVKQLDVYGAPDLALRSGGFSADEMIGAWKAAVAAVMYSAHFDLVRAVQVWSGRDVLPGTAELLLLESEMNRYLPLYPQVMVCLYDMNRFGGRIQLIVATVISWLEVCCGEERASGAAARGAGAVLGRDAGGAER